MPLPARLEGDAPKRVRVARDGKFKGLEGRVSLVYYDRMHTGSSYDLLEVQLDNGGACSGPADAFESIDAEVTT